MIVTVSIRQENTEEQRSVSASTPCIATVMALGIAIYDAGGEAIAEARAKGWVA
jgi:hypothetical protein